MSDNRPTREDAEYYARVAGASRLAQYAKYCLALLDENANLKRDKERLDAIEGTPIIGAVLWKGTGTLGWLVVGQENIYKTLREAIDAAMESTASEGE